MKATIVDLRYNMKQVLNTLDRNEPVTILHRGKERGIILPKLETNYKSVKEHPFFGMSADRKMSVEKEMEQLRQGRYHDL